MKQRASKLLINNTNSIKKLLLIYVFIIIIFASLYSVLENKTFFDALWWAVVTAMTVGYGDTYPITIGGRIIGVILMHIVPLFLIPLITANLASKLIVDSNAFTHKEQEEIKRGIKDIKKYLDNNK